MRTKFICLAMVFVLLSPNVRSQWVQTDGPGYPYPGVYSLVVSGTTIFAGTSDGGGVFLSTNNGTSWTAVNIGLTVAPVWSLAVSGTNLFAGTGSRGVFLTTNNGAGWTASSTCLTDTAVTSLAVSGTNLFAGTERAGVFLSTNNGISWTATALTNIYTSALVVSSLEVFAGTYGGVFRSTNNGTSWTAVNAGLTDTIVWSLAVSGTNLFAGTGGGGIFASSNYGASWTASNTGLPTQSLVVALVVSGSNVFAGTYDDGVFLSTNNGARWTAVNLGLPATPIYSFAIIGTYLLTGTGKGVWRRPLSEMITSVDGGVNELPHKFLLRQNYPNPFNPSTTIKYELPKSSQVTLSVYDVLGREVSVLVNEGKNAGVREVMFDASNLASGVYLYRLQAGDFVQTRKLIILR